MVDGGLSLPYLSGKISNLKKQTNTRSLISKHKGAKWEPNEGIIVSKTKESFLKFLSFLQDLYYTNIK